MPRPVKYAVGATKREVYKPAQQSCPPQEALPRYYYVQPLQNTPNAWSGAQTYADFEVPAQTGVMTEATLRFQLAFGGETNGATPPVALALPSLPSTPFWVDHIEIYIGSDLIETIWKHDIWNEEIGFRAIQDLEEVAASSGYSLYNSQLDGAFPNQSQSPTSIVANTSGNNYWFLNMPSCLRAAKPYVRGFQSRIKFRVYFPTSLVIDASPATKQSVSLNEVIMVVEEASTDPATIAELEKAHKQSVVDYTIVVRNRVQQTFAAGQVSNGNDVQIYLRGFKNKSAGVVVYATSANAFNQNSSATMNERFESSIYQLLDAQNNKITERLPVEWLTTYVFNDAVYSSSATQFDPHISTMIIFPFSSSFSTTIQKGCSYGGFRFTTLEQLVLNYAGSFNSSTGEDVVPQGIAGQTGTLVITATTYDYGHITIAGGRHSFRME